MDFWQQNTYSRYYCHHRHNDHCQGLAYLYTGGYPLYVEAPDFAYIGTGYLGPIPFPVVLLVVMVALWQFVLEKTRFGRYACALGGNKEAARLSGVKVDYFHILTFVVGGPMAAMSGVVYASRLLSVTPLQDRAMNWMPSPSTVVVEQVYLEEKVLWSEPSLVFLLTIIANVFNLMESIFMFNMLLEIAIILSAVGFDTYSKFGQ